MATAAITGDMEKLYHLMTHKLGRWPGRKRTAVEILFYRHCERGEAIGAYKNQTDARSQSLERLRTAKGSISMTFRGFFNSLSGRSTPPMCDMEIVVFAGCIAPSDGYVVHIGGWGAVPEPGCELFHFLLRPFAHDFHPAIGKVSHPSGQIADPMSLLRSRGAEKDTLHHPGDVCVRPELFHVTYFNPDSEVGARSLRYRSQ